MKRRALIWGAAVLAACAAVYCLWSCLLAPTEILIVNALPAREADLKFNSGGTHVKLTFRKPDDVRSFSGYDAVVLYARSLYLDSAQLGELQRFIGHGGTVYTYALRNYSFDLNANIPDSVVRKLDVCANNANAANCRNMLLWLRSVATPGRLPRVAPEEPIPMPDNLYYCLEPGRYFTDHDSLTAYLKNRGLYRPGAKNVAFISGVSFPVEGNRPYIDTLISRMQRAGMNVYPLVATGRSRARMLKKLKPDAIVYLPMGRIGNDSLVSWLNERNIPLFTPFPLSVSHEEWLDADRPIAGGTLNARILIPEIDGGIYPMCIATQQEVSDSIFSTVPEDERIDCFVKTVSRHLALGEKPEKDKRIAIGFFRNPGRDALIASGLEVAPSLYRTLAELRDAGYDLGNLPSTERQFENDLSDYCTVLGDYAPGAQTRLMDSGHVVWVDKAEYESWVAEALTPEKYREVERRYGKAPGTQMARGDSLALTVLRYGNVVIFPQPRPALGDDDFKLQHGAEVAPPHNYIATYLWLQKKFNMDALLHFGTHGNLEFTPGKNVGLSKADWAEALLGATPHFYLYVTSNVGEAIIAKRRSHAVMITHLIAPFVESGMRGRYRSLLDAIHAAIGASGKPAFDALSIKAKQLATAAGLHRSLRLDSVPSRPWTVAELEEADMLAEEIADEKITGANYVLGTPYGEKEIATSVSAVCADGIAYRKAKRDFEAGKISADELHDIRFVNHQYLSSAKKEVEQALASGGDSSVTACRDLFLASPKAELTSILRALDGGSVAPAPGGDPINSPGVLPTGRNMFSVNPETAPTEQSWETGMKLADATIEKYRTGHGGEYPRKVNYTFWAGEFISSEGATVAQAMYMLGVEPLRDDMGRVVDLKLIPEEVLGRPRIDVVVQVSGQLRDIAASRLKMITEAVRLAASAEADAYPNYVAEESRAQEKELIGDGVAPARARELMNMRVFGPINSGYGTGMLPYTENSGSWDDPQELVDGYINNMSAMYGDDDNWGRVETGLLPAALRNTAVLVQPRQSNTWGPLSLDHVYEYTGSVSMAVKSLSGVEPDAVMADYRNANMPRIQDTRQAVAVETRAALLNPDFIRERMKGGATTASNFGEMMRNVFGWSVTRSSVLDENIYDEIYDMYIADSGALGIREYFERVNPAAYQEIMGTMLESARKGYWKASDSQLGELAGRMADVTEKYGAPCTEFVCGNAKLRRFVADNLPDSKSEAFLDNMNRALRPATGGEVVLREQQGVLHRDNLKKVSSVSALIVIALFAAAAVVVAIVRVRRKKKE